MKSNTILYILLGVLSLGLVYLLFFKKSASKEDPPPTPVPPVNTGGVDCIPVPEGLQAATSALVPSEAQTYLGITAALYNDAFQQRLIGFFTAIDVQPTNERMKYFGKETILKYLASPMGQLPHWDVVKGSLRCKNVAGYTQNLFF
jgi:hypothetical protein